MEFWSELFTAAVRGYDAGKEKGWGKTLKWLVTRRKKVLVLGAAGAGKSLFIGSLKDPLGTILPGYQRTTAVKRKKVDIAEFPFLMIDTPGQELDEAKRKVPIKNAMKHGVEGIINVVCYGYHEGEAPRDDAVAKGGAGIADAEYLKRRRIKEIEQLSEWVPFIDPDMVKWVVTLASKADLWWQQERKVKEHYEDRGVRIGTG